MLASITPLGERGRGSIWAVTMAWFALGGLLGGALAGALAGGLGWLLLPAGFSAHARLAALAGALLVATLLDALTTSVPGPRRQVNERWLDEYRGWIYGFSFGAQLGLGLTTVVTSAALYAGLLAAMLSGTPARGAFILGVFGAVRGVTPLLAARVHSPSGLMTLHAALNHSRALSRWLAVAALTTATGAAAVGAFA